MFECAELPRYYAGRKPCVPSHNWRRHRLTIWFGAGLDKRKHKVCDGQRLLMSPV